jgi:hypothetical protein
MGSAVDAYQRNEQPAEGGGSEIAARIHLPGAAQF